MKPLTKKYVIENKLTPIGCVKYFKPKITKDEAEFILWEKTCFPFSTDEMIKQLNKRFLNV